jgi:hypothetical protein
MGAGLAMLMLAGPIIATPVAAAAGGDGAARAEAVWRHPRLAQGNDNKWLGKSEPDPGGLPGFRKEAPDASAPAARPMVPETRGGPKFHKSVPSDSDFSASSKRKDEKKDETK